jgi:prevent-host-death family protein
MFAREQFDLSLKIRLLCKVSADFVFHICKGSVLIFRLVLAIVPKRLYKADLAYLRHQATKAKISASTRGVTMKTLTAKDAKYRFGYLIDLARAEPVVIAKHGRPVVVALAVEEFEQVKAMEAATSAAVHERRNRP